MVYERLLDAFLQKQAQDIGVGDCSSPSWSPVIQKTSNRQAKIITRPGNLDKQSSTKNEKSAHTVNLFVENMDEKILTEIESCLLKTKGVVSFFSDVDDGKIIVRLKSENLVEEVIGYIYEVTKRRTSIIKGDYDSSGFPFYYTDANQKKNEGGFFSSLYSIISVSEVHAHPKDNKPKSGGWLSSWW